MGCFTVDNFELENIGLIALADPDDPPTYNFSADRLQIPGRPGFLKVNEKIEGRVHKFRFGFDSDTNIDIDEKLEQVNDLFFDIFGNRKLVRIEVFYWRGRHVYGYLKEVIPIERENVWSELEIYIECDDPFKYDNEVQVFYGQYGTQEINWGSTTVTFSDPYTFGYQSIATSNAPLNIEILNGGVFVIPEIIIKGSGDSITITGNGNTLNIGQFNGTLVIKEFISYLNGAEQFYNTANFYIKPGKNNISVSGINANFTIEVKIRKRYR